MCSTCVATVLGLIESSRPISAGPRPAASSPSTSRSRSVSVSRDRFSRIPGTFELTPDTRDELVRGDRLDEVVVRPHEEAGDPIRSLDPIGGDEEDRKPVTVRLPKPPAHLVTADVAEAHVEHDECDVPLAGACECLLA